VAALWLVISLVVAVPALASSSFSIDWETQAALNAVNDARIATGLPILRANPNLIQAASAHSSYNRSKRLCDLALRGRGQAWASPASDRRSAHWPLDTPAGSVR